MLLTTHPILVLQSWKSTAIPLPTHWACNRNTLPLPFTYYKVLSQNNYCFALYSCCLCTSSLPLPLLPVPPLSRPALFLLCFCGMYPAWHIVGNLVLAFIFKFGFGVTVQGMPVSLQGVVVLMWCFVCLVRTSCSLVFFYMRMGQQLQVFVCWETNGTYFYVLLTVHPNIMIVLFWISSLLHNVLLLKYTKRYYITVKISNMFRST